MGHRLSKIVTRTGDQGTTGLADGSRVDKDCARIEALGCLDEVNSAIAAILVYHVTPDVDACLTRVQHTLFDIGGELAVPGTVAVTEQAVVDVEQQLDAFNAALPPLKEFILPGGGPAAVAAHTARTVCRRAERRVFTLARAEDVNTQSRRYLNRLSDLLFVVARVLAIGDRGEVYWKRG